MKHYRLLIGGEDVDAANGETFESLNPTTGRPWATLALGGTQDVDRAVRAAGAAFESEAWRALSPTRRGRLLMRLADLIADRAEEIARIEVTDNGKLYKEMRAQLRVIPDWLYYFGGLADKVEGRVIPLDRTSVLNYTLREPLGVVGIIVPWNSPVLLTMYSLCPALAAGNTVVVKPSEHASASILETLRLADEAGFPPGVVNVVTGTGAAGAALVAHPGVAKISFTGSETTGKKIAAAAGVRLAATTMELGGKSPNIVFADAPIDAAEAGLLAGIFAAAGQTCVAGSRALLQRPVYDELAGADHGTSGRRRAGRPDGRRDPDGPDRERPAARADRGDGRGGERRRRAGRRRVPSGGLGLRGWSLLRPHGRRRGRQRRADRAGRGLRPRADGASLRHRGGSDRDCERHSLRPRGWGLDKRREAGAPGRAATQGGDGLDQPLSRDHVQLALRRLQGERLSAASTGPRRSTGISRRRVCGASSPRRSRIRS